MKKLKVIMLCIMMSLMITGCKTDSPASNQAVNTTPSSDTNVSREEDKNANEVEDNDVRLQPGFENWEKTDAVRALNQVLTLEVTVKGLTTSEDNSGEGDPNQYYLNEIDQVLDYSFDQRMLPNQYAVVDLDHDDSPEVIVSLRKNVNEYDEWMIILRYYEGSVYGYPFVLRGFEFPKTDGRYLASSGAIDNQIMELNFDGYKLQENCIGYSKMVNDEVEYFIADNKVSEEEFLDFTNRFYNSEDVSWYLFPSNVRAGYTAEELFHADFYAITQPVGKELTNYYSEVEGQLTYSHSSRIPGELCDLIIEAMNSEKEEETFGPLKTGTEVSQEEFCKLTGMNLTEMESVTSVKVDADNDGIQDLVGEIYWGGTGGFCSMVLNRGLKDGGYERTNSFENLLQEYSFISYQGKNYMLMREFDYDTKYDSGYTLYLYEEGTLADGMIFSFEIEDYDMRIAKEVSSYDGMEQIRKTLSNKELPLILGNNSGVIDGTAEKIGEENGDYRYTCDIDNDGNPEYYNKSMWYPSNMGTVMQCIYDFKNSNVLGDLSGRLADEVGEGRLYTFWIDRINEEENIIYLYYGNNLDYSLYAYRLMGEK